MMRTKLIILGLIVSVLILICLIGVCLVFIVGCTIHTNYVGTIAITSLVLSGIGLGYYSNFVINKIQSLW
jgi:general stress protein CsbA